MILKQPFLVEHYESMQGQDIYKNTTLMSEDINQRESSFRRPDDIDVKIEGESGDLESSFRKSTTFKLNGGSHIGHSQDGHHGHGNHHAGHGDDLGGLILNQSLDLARAGILTLKPLSAKLLRASEMLGKMTPYCTLTYNGKKYKTNGDGDGDKEPVWDDEFKLQVQNLTDDVVIRIWD